MKPLFLLLLTTLSFGAETRTPWERDPVFLAKNAISVTDALPGPPAPGSPADRADFGKLLTAQASRTSADCARAATEVSVSLGNFDGPPYGPLTAEEVRAWTPFFEKVRIDTEFFVQAVKRRWHRPRPYMADPRLVPCVRREKTDAYPSGHAANSEVFARVLTLIDPARQAAFAARARRIGDDRVLGGVHHPSDIAAGRALGDRIFTALEKSAAFQKAVSALKK
jgi:acid phosphatase (class A)